MEKQCQNCKHFNNEGYENKNYGYCAVLDNSVIIAHPKGRKAAMGSYLTVPKDFGCIKFEKK